MKTKNAQGETSPLGIHAQKAVALKCGSGESITEYPITLADLLEVKGCPLCENRDVEIIAQVYLGETLNFFETSTCRQCLFTYRSIHPRLAWFEACWRKIDEKVFSKTGMVFNPEGERLRKARYEEYLGILARFGKGKLLDIGAAWGTGASVFKQNGYAVHAIEPEVGKRNHLREVLDIPVLGESIQEVLATPTMDFNVIIFSHCLEHIEGPASVVRDLGKLMKRGSLLYLEVPLLWNYVNWSDALFLPHKSNFTEGNLIDLARESGFVLVERHWLYKHSQNEPDLGFVLRYTGGRQFNKPLPRHTVADVRALYRKGLPLTYVSDSVLRYSVPVIEHAAQIIVAEGKTMAYENGFIVFR